MSYDFSNARSFTFGTAIRYSVGQVAPSTNPIVTTLGSKPTLSRVHHVQRVNTLPTPVISIIPLSQWYKGSPCKRPYLLRDIEDVNTESNMGLKRRGASSGNERHLNRDLNWFSWESRPKPTYADAGATCLLNVPVILPIDLIGDFSFLALKWGNFSVRCLGLNLPVCW